MLPFFVDESQGTSLGLSDALVLSEQARRSHDEVHAPHHLRGGGPKGDIIND